MQLDLSSGSLIGFKLLPILFLLMISIIPLVLIGVYVYRDATRRNMPAALWTGIAILGPCFTGFIVYLIVRGRSVC